MLSRDLAGPARPRPSSCWKLTNSFTSPLLSPKDAEHQILAALGVVIEPVVLLVVQDAQKTVLVVVGGTLTIGGGGDQAILARHVLSWLIRMDSCSLGMPRSTQSSTAVVGKLSGGIGDQKLRSFDLLADALGQVGQLLLEHAVLDRLLGRTLAEIAHQQAGRGHGEDDGGQIFCFSVRLANIRGDSEV